MRVLYLVRTPQDPFKSVMFRLMFCVKQVRRTLEAPPKKNAFPLVELCPCTKRSTSVARNVGQCCWPRALVALSCAPPCQTSICATFNIVFCSSTNLHLWSSCSVNSSIHTTSSQHLRQGEHQKQAKFACRRAVCYLNNKRAIVQQSAKYNLIFECNGN